MMIHVLVIARSWQPSARDTGDMQATHFNKSRSSAYRKMAIPRAHRHAPLKTAKAEQANYSVDDGQPGNQRGRNEHFRNVAGRTTSAEEALGAKPQR